MKRFKIGFLAVIAILAMSFTITSNTSVFKKARVTISDCYKPSFTDFKYLSNCQTATFTSVTNCTTGNNSEGQYLDPSFGLGTYEGNTIDCIGTDVVCCVKFQQTSTAPSCQNPPSVLKGTVDSDDGEVHINPLATTYIKVLQVECEAN